MADVLICSSEATQPQGITPIARGVPVATLAADLGLTAKQWVTPPGKPPFINRRSGEWAAEKDSYVLALVAGNEGPWKPGYYLLAITPTQARDALGLAQPDAA